MNEPKVYEDRMYKTAKKLGLPGVAVVSKKDQTTDTQGDTK